MVGAAVAGVGPESGEIFEYPEAADGTPMFAAPKEIEEPELV